MNENSIQRVIFITTLKQSLLQGFEALLHSSGSLLQCFETLL